MHSYIVGYNHHCIESLAIESSGSACCWSRQDDNVEATKIMLRDMLESAAATWHVAGQPILKAPGGSKLQLLILDVTGIFLYMEMCLQPPWCSPCMSWVIPNGWC